MQVSELRTFLENLEEDDELLMVGPDLLTASRAGQVLDCFVLKLPRITLSTKGENIDTFTRAFWKDAKNLNPQ